MRGQPGSPFSQDRFNGGLQGCFGLPVHQQFREQFFRDSRTLPARQIQPLRQNLGQVITKHSRKILTGRCGTTRLDFGFGGGDAHHPVRGLKASPTGESQGGARFQQHTFALRDWPQMGEGVIECGISQHGGFRGLMLGPDQSEAGEVGKRLHGSGEIDQAAFRKGAHR